MASRLLLQLPRQGERDAGIGFTGDKATVDSSAWGPRSQSVVALCSKYISPSALLLIIVGKVIRPS